MRKIIITGLLVVWMGAQAFAFDVGYVAVVADGRIGATGTYIATGGENPFFETRYASDYSARGTGGLAVTNKFSGTLLTNEQFEVQAGYGRFLTKAGTGLLVNIADEQTGLIRGTLTQNAVGFAGFLQPGAVQTSFQTEEGLVGIAEAEGIGSIRAGSIQQITIGTSSPGTTPVVVERLEVHVKIGPGQFQFQGQFGFPK